MVQQANQPAPTPVTLITGLDLGQAHDPTAMAVLERSLVEHKGRKASSYVARYLNRWALGTPYTTICDDMAKFFSKPLMLGTMLVVDRTGVGRAVVDMLERTLTPTAEALKAIKAKHAGRVPQVLAQIRKVSITGGQSINPSDGGGWNVPKKELVSCLKVLMQSGRFKIVPTLPLAATVEKELQNFKVKITTAQNETFEAWREGDFDDLVLAIAIAVWQAERAPPSGPMILKNGGVLRPGLNLAGPPGFQLPKPGRGAKPGIRPAGK